MMKPPCNPVWVVLVVLVCGVSSVFQDEVGLYDWKITNIGKVSQAQIFIDHIFVITEVGVVASLNKHTGDIEWRRVLPNGEIAQQLFLSKNGQQLITVVEQESKIYTWKTTDGALLWEQSISPESSNSKLRYPPVIFLREDKTLEEIVVLNENQLFLISGSGGTLLWHSVSVPGKAIGLGLDDAQRIVVGTISQTHFGLHHWDTESGVLQQLQQSATQSLPDSHALKAFSSLPGHFAVHWSSQVCIFSIKHASRTSCLALNEYFSDSELAKAKINVFQTPGKQSESKIQLSLEGNSQRILLDWHQEKFSKLSQTPLDQSLIVQSKSWERFFAELQHDDRGFDLKISDPGAKSSTARFEYSKENHGAPQKIFSNLRGEYLLVSRADALGFFASSAEPVWWREESLAQVLSAQFVPVPISSTVNDQLTKIKDASGIFMQFLTRIQYQIQSLEEYLVEETLHPSHELHKDRFGFNSLVVFSTKAGKVVCVTTEPHHPILWTVFLPDQDIVEVILTRLSTKENSELLVISKDRLTNRSVLNWINPFNGRQIQSQQLSYSISHTIHTPQRDQAHRKIVFLVDDQQNVHVSPSDLESYSLAVLGTNTYDFQVFTKDSSVQGFRFVDSVSEQAAFSLQELWRIQFAENETIVNVATHHDGHIHLPVRLVTPEEPIPKYINRNLVAIATQTDDGSVDSFISVYLVDSITGTILHHTTHANARDPIHMIVCENWVMYTCWNKKSFQTEISVIELYEPSLNWNPTTFSSFEHISPVIYQQSFELPFTATAIGVTQTRRGITTRHIVLGTHNQQIISIDKRWIDPLRPQEDSAPKAGLFKYSPELKLFDRSFISYNQTVEKVTNIISSSTHVESTSLILAWGIDQFFSHVRPADKFDMLKADFDYVNLITTVVFVVAITLIARSLNKRKQLSMKWK